MLKSDGKGVPKMTEMLAKATSPGSHLRGRQTLKMSKFISGAGCTSDQ